MGEHNISENRDSAELRSFVRNVLRDLRALEKMLADDLIESDITRIGAEQEFFLVDDAWRPTPAAEKVLAACQGMNVTPELARFNIEFNAPPFEFRDDCFAKLEAHLLEGYAGVSKAAAGAGVKAVMTGILPTLVTSDLNLRNMSDSERYRAFDEALKQLRGGDYQFRIRGHQELNIRHDSVMIEACNTSFQVHMQIAPKDFASKYNVAQLVAGPSLACAVNSPMLFGKRLWMETRLALFQQSMDTRKASHHDRESKPRVSFGTEWIRESVLEIFREDIARFRVLVGMEVEEDPFEVLSRGGAPGLAALCLHNGTVYRWNRPCYGNAGNVGHLRIENRILPAGPTVADEVANSAFWLGLVYGGAQEIEDIPSRLDFDEANANLTAAARHGLAASFSWLDGRTVSAPVLIAEELLPMAERGLRSAGILEADINHYLGIIEARVASGKTGAQWLMQSYAGMKGPMSKTEKMAALTAGMAKRQALNTPVHEWDLAAPVESGSWLAHCQRVEQYMSTELFTVNEDEAVDLVAALMDWRRIRHVPVEDDDDRLVGLVSNRILLRMLAQGGGTSGDKPISVGDIMQRDLTTVGPETTTLEVIEIMRTKRIACLPVVKDGRLIGLVTEGDLVRIAAPLMEGALREEAARCDSGTQSRLKSGESENECQS